MLLFHCRQSPSVLKQTGERVATQADPSSAKRNISLIWKQVNNKTDTFLRSVGYRTSCCARCRRILVLAWWLKIHHIPQAASACEEVKSLTVTSCSSLGLTGVAEGGNLIGQRFNRWRSASPARPWCLSGYWVSPSWILFSIYYTEFEGVVVYFTLFLVCHSRFYSLRRSIWGFKKQKSIPVVLQD